MASNDQDYTSGMMGRSGLCHPVEVGLDELTRLRAIEAAAREVLAAQRDCNGDEQDLLRAIEDKLAALRAALDTKP